MKDQNATVAAGFLGWMLDAFDFFLVVMTLTAIGKEFGKTDAAIALSLTLTLRPRAVRPVAPARSEATRSPPHSTEP
jgi:SHS family lactate transporter-like MFS transporter